MTTWDAVLAAVHLALAGAGEEARRALTACWEDTAETDAAKRCVLAHYLADVQSTVEDEVAWDLVALTAHAHVRDEDLAPVGVPSAAGFAPSLHLNLADGYRRLGRLDDARAQVGAGLRAAEVLPEDGYGTMIRNALERVAERLTAIDG